MKNIHLIHVNRAKASLYHCSNTRDFFTTEQTSGDLLYELYITSGEEVKEGDWVFNFEYDYIVQYDSKKHDDKFWYKKIILTTDPKLIEDGVQAIDNEFLEWFIKNPSCEEVEIQKWFEDGTILEYKIIIPKEEPGQETLEEAAIRLFNDFQKNNPIVPKNNINPYKLGFIEGAKWQQERMYSAEEVIKLLQKALTHQDDGKTGSLVTAQGEIRPPNFYSWFEQFKKK